MAGDIALVDSAATTAIAVENLLREKQLMANGGNTVSRKFLATDAPDRFARVGEIFLGQAIDPGDVELIDLQ